MLALFLTCILITQECIFNLSEHLIYVTLYVRLALKWTQAIPNHWDINVFGSVMLSNPREDTATLKLTL